MTYSEALKACTTLFEENGIENAGNESRWLLESIDDGFLLKLRDEMDEDDLGDYYDLAQRRTCGEPLQYLLGKWEFYGRDFCCGKGVLIPRPETEMLVDFAKDYLRDKPEAVVVDLCTGTGCIGLTVAKEIPSSKVYLIEKYDEAFSYLQKNSLNVKNAEIIKQDIFDDITIEKCDLILSNPPYVRPDEIKDLQKELQYEPVTALDGGEDGLDFYRRIKEITKELLPGCVVLEIGEDQGEDIKTIFAGTGKVEIRKDCYGNDRMAVINCLNN